MSKMRFCSTEDMVLLDVAEEVLLRLPVKDLVRCKSVCKSWYSLISSPYFIKLHVKFMCEKEEKENKQLGNRRIAMTERYLTTSGRWLTIPKEWLYYDSLRIQGSSNGLVCMSSFGNKICLTNPWTRVFRKLHKPPILPKDVSYAQRYGFGYDSSTDDYKLVMAINQRGSDGALVQILSLKSNIWKLFGRVNYMFDDREPGILFDGALHWFMHTANSDKVFLVSFDLAKEEFREIPQPDDDKRYVWSWQHRLGIFKHHLCIFCKRKDGRPHGIWVMKNKSLRQSWELVPADCEMMDRVHYMVKDCLLSKRMPSYFCCKNTFLSTSGKHIWSPIVVQTLVSPFINNHGRPSDANKNKRRVQARSSKESREIEEACTLKDGEKDAFYREDNKTKRKRFKGNKRQ